MLERNLLGRYFCDKLYALNPKPTEDTAVTHQKQLPLKSESRLKSCSPHCYLMLFYSICQCNEGGGLAHRTAGKTKYLYWQAI